jgi:hypothetical protein
VGAQKSIRHGLGRERDRESKQRKGQGDSDYKMFLLFLRPTKASRIGDTYSHYVTDVEVALARYMGGWVLLDIPVGGFDTFSRSLSE